jgi:VanZ family protein
MDLPSSKILVFRMALLAALIVITHLATTSMHYPVVEDIYDKVNHILAFYVLALLIDFSFPNREFGLAKVSVLLGYGLAIESIQYFLPYRSASLSDVAADAVGLLMYWFSLPVLRQIPWIRSRWDIETDKN